MDGTLSGKFHPEKHFNIEEIKKKLYEIYFEIGTWRTYKKGNIIFQSGDTSDAAYVVKEGRVRLFRTTPEGKESIFHIINPSEGFGFAEIILNRPRIRNAMVMKDNMTLCVINGEKLLNLMCIDADVCFGLTFLQSEYLLRYQMMAADMANLSVRSRVIQLILKFTQEFGKTMKDYILIELPYTHDEIAKMVGTSRQTVTSILNDLHDSGYFILEHKKIKISQLDLLESSL